MACVEENGLRVNAQILFQLCPDIGEIRIFDRSDFRNGHGIDGHDNGGDFCGFVRHHQRFHKRRIAPGVGIRMSDVDLGGAGDEVLRGEFARP